MNSFKTRLWIGLGVIFVSIVAGAGAFYYYSGAIQAEADQVVSLKTAQASQANAIANLAALKNDAPKAAMYDAALMKLLPDQSGLITFNTWVSQAAAKYGVTATVAYKGDPTPASGASPGSINFTMVAQGPSGEMMPFLDYITSKDAGFMISFASFDFTNDRSQENLTAQGISYFR